ncbi:hypothetical protein IAD21_02475 [Abditibacteriota bacterium]|nr:hypothetical protein IAD21_02475 [Abditibacteriota bacterium]
MRSFLSLILIVLSSTAILQADPITISRKVVYADGSPAAKVDVLVRSLSNWRKPPDAEKIVQTDADGVFSTQLDVPPTKYHSGYVLVKAPDYALFYESFTEDWLGQPARTDNALKLTSHAEVHGVISDTANAPVANATVELRYFSDNVSEAFITFNDPKHNLRTPWLQAQSDEKGNYSLRPVVFAKDPSGVSTFEMIARADIAGNIAKGRGDVSPYEVVHKANIALNFTLRPTDTLHGHVVNQLTHAPIAGATVELRGDSTSDIPATTTDATGTWEIKGAPHDSEMYVIANSPDYAEHFAPTKNRQGQLLADPTIQLAPLVEVSGVVLDTISGKPVPSPLTIEIPPYYIENNNISVRIEGQKTRTDATSHFSIRVPAGTTKFNVSGPGYDAHVESQIPAQGAHDLKWTVGRRAGVLVEFRAQNPRIFEDAYIDARVGTSSSSAYNTRFYFVWADNVKQGTDISLKRLDRVGPRIIDLTPPTKISPDETRWPLVINVP